MSKTHIRKPKRDESAKAKPGSLHPVVKPLGELLKEAESHFQRNRASHVYEFTLGKFPDGWSFRVVNSYQLWMSAGRTYEFGCYPTPEEAVQSFLTYVRDNRIMVSGLQEA